MRPETDSGLTQNASAPLWMAQAERGRPAAIRAFARMALKLGRGFTRLLLHPAVIYFLLFSIEARVASRAYLRRVLGRKAFLSEVYRHFYAFAAVVLDRVYLLNGEYGRFDVRTLDEGVVREVRDRGSGGFLLGAHVGSFEMLRVVGREAGAPRVRIIMYEETTRYLNDVLGKINPEVAEDVIGLGSVDSMLKVEQGLARGEFMGMLADRTIHADGTIAVTFMGAPAHFPLGPFRIAAIMRRPVCMIFGLYRGGNRYEVHFERLVDFSTISRAERDAVIEKAVHHYVARLEHYCRLAPYNWFNFYDFWR